MKRLFLIVLIGLFCMCIMFIGTDDSLMKSGDKVKTKYFKGTERYKYGPRGKISSPNGKELFPAYPSTVTRSHLVNLG